jgi:hypothetical protein
MRITLELGLMDSEKAFKLFKKAYRKIKKGNIIAQIKIEGKSFDLRFTGNANEYREYQEIDRVTRANYILEGIA